MSETFPPTGSESPKPKLELQPYSESEIWVALERESIFNSREEISAYLNNVAEKMSDEFKSEIIDRKIFIASVGKQIRISTGGFRDFKPEELEKIKQAVSSLS